MNESEEERHARLSSALAKSDANATTRLLRLQYRPAAAGTVTDRIVAVDRSRGYQFVRVLCQALQGKVKLAVVCERHVERGGVSFSPGTAPFRLVAVKQLLKECIRRHCTVDGHRVQENAMNEVAVLQRLNAPGHRNVLRLIDFLADDENFFVITEYLENGELFDALSSTTDNESLTKSMFPVQG